MDYKDVIKRFPDFKIDGTEGSRVGYWCERCQEPIPIGSYRVTAEYGTQFINIRHDKCGHSVESIRDEEIWEVK